MKEIRVEDTQNIRKIQINRPEKLNALNMKMYEALIEAFEEGEADPNISVFYLYGYEHCFTAGHDLNDFIRGERMEKKHPTVRFLYQLLDIKKPIVASVRGHAMGIGTTLLLHCDLVYAGDNAHFQVPFINLNLVPEAAASFLLPRLVGQAKANEYLMLGEPFYAEEALSVGMVNAVFETEHVDEKAFNIALKLAKKPQEALEKTKALLRDGVDGDRIKSHLKAELKEFAKHLVLDETKVRMQKALPKPI